MLAKPTAFLALACALALPSTAVAQSDRPDPDSPAGVEYELPLDQTRKYLTRDDRGGRNGGDGGQRNSGPAPLFGAGISRAGDSDAHRDSLEERGGSPGDGRGSAEDGGDSPDRDAASDDRADSGTTRGRSSGSDEADAADPALASLDSGDGSGSTGVVISGLVLAVLLAGAALGFFLRRGFGRTQE